MSDHNSGSTGRHSGRSFGDEENSSTDAFSEALLDVAASRPGRADLSEEERALLDEVSSWLPALPPALARAEEAVDAGGGLATTPIRHDDPIARMLGLIEDPERRLDGGRLTAAREVAGVTISELADRLQQRGWDATVETVAAWESDQGNPPPATIDAVAEALAVSVDALIAVEPISTEILETSFIDDPLGHLEAGLTERLGQTVRYMPREGLSQRTPYGRFDAFAKVDYLDTSVLLVIFDDPLAWPPTMAHIADGVRSLVEVESDVNAVVVACGEFDAILLTRAAMRPALLLPDGSQSDAAATIRGLTLLDTLCKYLDGEQTAWEVLEHDEGRLPRLNIGQSAKVHAMTAIANLRKSGSRSQEPKKQTWTGLSDDLADVIASFVSEVSKNDVENAIESLGVDAE